VVNEGTALGEPSWCAKLNKECTEVMSCLLILGISVKADQGIINQSTVMD
jgi:hypothetical protein